LFVEDMKTFWKEQKTNFKLMVLRDSISHLFGKRTGVRLRTRGYEAIYIKRLGASPVEIGFINSFVSLFNLVLGVPTGWIIDRTTNVKKIYIMGLFLGLPGFLLMALVDNWISILLILLWLSFPLCLSAPLQAIIDVDSMSNKNRVYGLSIHRLMTAATGVVSPIILAYIVDISGGIDSVTGIKPVLLLWFLSDIIVLVLLFMKLKDVHIIREPERASLFGGLKYIFSGSTPLRTILVRDVISFFVAGMSIPFTAIYQVDIKMASVFIFGLIGVAEPAVDLLFTTPAARLIARFGRRKIGYLACIVGSIARLVLVLTPSTFPELLILYIGISSVEGCLMLGFDAYNVEIIPQEIRGKWIGFRSLIIGLSGIAAPVLGGLIWNINPDYLYWLSFIEHAFVAFPFMILLMEKYSNDGMVKSSNAPLDSQL